ncbi:Vmc-like lipoprotein signal peptide domain-containing protein [Ureaplasma canigenitalium]|uniref:Vmc-like lipoprotein signal peptide domain-containing protein n=1 Tax=Ureaplasma canigenitalium TaxID=42092 RepID=UPI0004E14046|nr:hypothetical protein [Ureaplasma canigenitalium]
MKINKKKHLYLTLGMITITGLVTAVSAACRNTGNSVTNKNTVTDVTFSEVTNSSAKVTINFLQEINPNKRVSVKLNDKVFIVSTTNKTKSVTIPVSGLNPRVAYTVNEVRVDGVVSTLNNNVQSKKIDIREGDSNTKPETNDQTVPDIKTEIKVNTIETIDVTYTSAKVKITLLNEISASSNVVLTLGYGEKNITSSKINNSSLNTLTFDFSQLEMNTEYTIKSLMINNKVVSLSSINDQKSLRFKTPTKKNLLPNSDQKNVPGLNPNEKQTDNNKKVPYDFDKLDQSKVTVTYKNASETLFSLASTDAKNYLITLDSSLTPDLSSIFVKAVKTNEKITVTYKLVAKTKSGEKEFTKDIPMSIFKAPNPYDFTNFDSNYDVTVKYKESEKVTFHQAEETEDKYQITLDSTLTNDLDVKFVSAKKSANKITITLKLVAKNGKTGEKQFVKELSRSVFKTDEQTEEPVLVAANDNLIVNYKEADKVDIKDAELKSEKYELKLDLANGQDSSKANQVTVTFVKAEKASDNSKITITYKLSIGNVSKEYSKDILANHFKNDSTAPSKDPQSKTTDNNTAKITK